MNFRIKHGISKNAILEQFRILTLINYVPSNEYL